MTAPPSQVLAAEWVLPVSAPPVPDGAVALEADRIAWVGPRRELPSRFLRAPLRAFPRGLLLPGWVNAHSHLHLTGAVGRLTGTAGRFADWLRAAQALAESWPPEIFSRAVIAGLDLLATTGTTTVGHAAPFPEIEPFVEHPLRAVVFHEAAGFPADRAGEALRQAEEWLDGAAAVLEEAGCSRVTLGLAPHAPYSTSPRLLQGLTRLARRRGLPIAVHGAESQDEAELLGTGGGPLRELLREREAWDPHWKPPGQSPVTYLQSLEVLDAPGLLFPAACLEAGDVDRLRAGRLIPTFSPGSQAFFGRPPHPAPELLAAGVPVALATESLAANAGLNMLREARLAAEQLPDVPRELWLRAGTLTAAEALGLGASTGSLEPGKAADLQVLQTSGEEPGPIADPLAALFEGRLRVRAVYVAGAALRLA